MKSIYGKKYSFRFFSAKLACWPKDERWGFHVHSTPGDLEPQYSIQIFLNANIYNLDMFLFTVVYKQPFLSLERVVLNSFFKKPIQIAAIDPVVSFIHV